MFDIFHLEGFLYHSTNGFMLVLSDKELKDPDVPKIHYKYNDIQESIEKHFGGGDYICDDSFWGSRTVVPNVSMRIYATNKKCSLDDAVGALITKLYGELDSDIGYAGYSEYTVTDYFCDKFAIGGHDLQAELSQYVGKYVHIVIETEVP